MTEERTYASTLAFASMRLWAVSSQSLASASVSGDSFSRVRRIDCLSCGTFIGGGFGNSSGSLDVFP